MLFGKNSLIAAGGVLLGIALCLVFRSCDDSEIPLSPDTGIILPSVIAGHAEQEEKYFSDKIDSLHTKTKSLDKELATANDLLRRSKQKNSALQKELLALSNNRLVAGTNTPVNPGEDSFTMRLNTWIMSGNEKDSLYEVVIGNQSGQLQVKDSVIVLQQQQYSSLKDDLNTSLVQGNRLIKENVFLQKNIKRRKLQNKLLSGLTAIVAGFTVSYMIKH